MVLEDRWHAEALELRFRNLDERDFRRGGLHEDQRQVEITSGGRYGRFI